MKDVHVIHSRYYKLQHPLNEEVIPAGNHKGVGAIDNQV